MIGLIVIFAAFFYLLASALIVIFSYRYGESRYEKGILFGSFAALLMYNLIFWDVIPVYSVHYYRCIAESTVNIYITPEQWLSENPETIGEDWASRKMMARKTYNKNYGYISERNHSRTWMSSSVVYERKMTDIFSGDVKKLEESIIDVKNEKVMASAVNFIRGKKESLKFNELIMSIGSNYCKGSIEEGRKGMLYNYLNQLKLLGRG